MNDFNKIVKDSNFRNSLSELNEENIKFPFIKITSNSNYKETRI